MGNVRPVLLAAVFFLLPFAFLLFPFFYMAAVSVTDQPDFLTSRQPVLLTLAHYRSVLTSELVPFTSYLRNSMIVAAASAALCVLAASMAAYAVTRIPFRGRVGLLLFVLCISMFPQISLIGYLFKLMSALGWVNTYLALVLPYVAWTLPLSLWILVSYFAQIPKAMDEAACVDGCSRWQVLFRIILPVATPGIFSVFLIAFISAFNELMFALMLTTDHRARTVPVGISLFEGLHGQTPWGEIMAASIITTLPVALLALLFQRHIIGGLTRGAVKE